MTKSKRQVKRAVRKGKTRPAAEIATVGVVRPLERAAEACPYCESKDFVKRGIRENKHQKVQLYKCRNIGCERTFTSRTIKGKQFPWPVVLDAISYHNLGYTFEQCGGILETKRGVRPQAETIAKWYEEYKPLCRFERLRSYALKLKGILLIVHGRKLQAIRMCWADQTFGRENRSRIGSSHSIAAATT